MTYRDEFRDVQREALWTAPRIFVGLLLLLVMLYGIGFLATGGDLAIYRFWAPKQANAQREVFVNTNAYIQGKTDYLNRLRFQYTASKDDDEKAALKTLILSEAANVDNSKLPPDLAAFISSLKGY